MATTTSASPTQLSRVLLGPLTATTWTPAASCFIAVADCSYTVSGCSEAYLGQTCAITNPAASTPTSTGVFDDIDCWPPTEQNANVPAPSQPFAGWGFYSPGFHCPPGYTGACTAVNGASAAWTPEFPLLPGETAVGCCPSDYNCGNEEGDNWGNRIIQTCQSFARASSSVSIGGCQSGTLMSDLTTLQLPLVVQTSDASFSITTYKVWAPMIDYRWQSSDTMTTSSSSHSGSSSVTSAGPTSSSPAPPSGELSTGDEAAVGVVVPVVVVAAIAGLTIWWRRRRRQQRRGHGDEQALHGAELGGTPLNELGDSPKKAVEMDSGRNNKSVAGRHELKGSDVHELEGTDVPMLGDRE